jgi:hypothetical protein
VVHMGMRSPCQGTATGCWWWVRRKTDVVLVGGHASWWGFLRHPRHLGLPRNDPMLGGRDALSCRTNGRSAVSRHRWVC